MQVFWVERCSIYEHSSRCRRRLSSRGCSVQIRRSSANHSCSSWERQQKENRRVLGGRQNKLTWFLLKKRVNLLISLSTSTSRTPPNLSIHSSTCCFEYVWVPLRAPWATNWATELFSIFYCLLPTLMLTVMAAWFPGQYSVATLTPLLSLVTVVALEAWRASGISPHGNYPKSTNRFLLNWRYYLREGACVWALVT